jgi:hypothetical protein
MAAVPRGLRACIVGLCLLPLLGCRATVDVAISVAPAGSGTVAVTLELDRDATQRIGDLRSALRISDLERVGWVMSGPATGSDGSTSVTITHPFATAAEGTALLASLGAPVRLSVSHRPGVTSSSVSVDGTVDLRAGADAFADDGVRAALGVASLASVLAGVARQGGEVPTLDARIEIRLPGRPHAVRGRGTITGDTVAWDIPLGSAEDVGAQSHSPQAGATLSIVATGAAIFALGLWLVVRTRRADRGPFSSPF